VIVAARAVVLRKRLSAMRVTGEMEETRRTAA